MKFTKKKKILVVILVLIGILFLIPDPAGENEVFECLDCKIKSATIDPSVLITLPINGDGWTSTLSNGKLYFGFNDGTGQNTICNPPVNSNDGDGNNPCQIGTNGIISMSGNPTSLVQSGINTQSSDSDIISLLIVGDRLYAHMIDSSGSLAYSDDKGKTWITVFKRQASNFKNSFFVQLPKDNYIYSMGIQDTKNSWNLSQDIYLNRIDKNSITDLAKYEYFSGLVNGNPIWSKNESDARPLDGLQTIVVGSAMYHSGLDRYIFLTGWAEVTGLQSSHGFLAPDEGVLHPFLKYGGIYEAKNVWGKWKQVGFFESGYDCNNTCYREAIIIPKAFTNKQIFFSFGWTGNVDLFPVDESHVTRPQNTSYELNIGKIKLETFFWLVPTYYVSV